MWQRLHAQLLPSSSARATAPDEAELPLVSPSSPSTLAPSSSSPSLLDDAASRRSAGRSGRWTPTTRRKPVVLALAVLSVLALLYVTQNPSSWTTDVVRSSRWGAFGGATAPKRVEVTLAQVHENGFPLATGPATCDGTSATVYRLRNSSRACEDWFSPSPPLPRTASLSARLEDWLAAPVGSYDLRREFNLLSCGNPSVRRQRNQLQVRENGDLWRSLAPEQIREIRRELVQVLRVAERSGRFAEPEDRKGTRGLVWTAGNADTFDRVLVSLRLLRGPYNSTLPAEIFHFPDEAPTDDQRRDFLALGATVSSLTSLDKGPLNGRTKSFHLKGAALVESKFDEVLMLDSDNIPVRDVDFLFRSIEFRELGAVFWPDYWKDQPENVIWSILGVQCRDEFTMEAGQMLIRKSDHLDALLLVEHMLREWEFWFKISDGDKDLFRYAFLALRKRWAVPARHLSTASWTDRDRVGADKHDRFAGHTMLQYGLASESGGLPGRPLFVHANLLKRILGNLHDGNTFGRTLQLRLPAADPARASDPDFVFHCDYLANVSPVSGIGLAPFKLSSATAPPLPPLWVRQRALLSRGLETRFFDGHLDGGYYILAIESGWRDETASLGEGAELEDAMSEKERERWRQVVLRERAAGCGDALQGITGPGGEGEGMKIVAWQDDPDLAGFENRFYAAGGRAGGAGFRL